jgi:hypothetical protein
MKICSPAHIVDYRKPMLLTEKVIHRIWSIGGSTGWYYGAWLWGIQVLLITIWCAGLRRAENQNEISPVSLDSGVF